MVPKNLTEAAVQEMLRCHREKNADTEGVCWCPLCTADMQALALSCLPPRYITRRESLAGNGAVRDDIVREVVARAVQRVDCHPKHPKAAAGAPADKVALVNYPFEIGFTMIEERMSGRAGACECWECRCDAVAFALNRFPPQYGVAVGDRSPFLESSRKQMAEELVSFLDLGVQIATTVPRH